KRRAPSVTERPRQLVGAVEQEDLRARELTSLVADKEVRVGARRRQPIWRNDRPGLDPDLAGGARGDELQELPDLGAVLEGDGIVTAEGDRLVLLGVDRRPREPVDRLARLQFRVELPDRDSADEAALVVELRLGLWAEDGVDAVVE